MAELVEASGPSSEPGQSQGENPALPLTAPFTPFTARSTDATASGARHPVHYASPQRREQETT
ncbi:hypothetical protein [Microbacterium sp. Kw_RZR3]|uniref:hypothetical protein n=1 Tax=unclassified Microbacterium TaxID=2609290 RepID=UPI0023DBEC1A|nr:hypothetical protein [Microbacterium sp. Kw_RZR3]MDF2047202.1 hypothetical protein [Microbacterium sp. Kw_RZR3]